jgi:hypothetical protein
MRYLSILSACLIALALFLAQSDSASADWRGQQRGGSGTGQYGRGTTVQTQQRGTTAWQRSTPTQRGPAMAQRGAAAPQTYRAPAQARGQARPGRAGEIDPTLLAGAFGGLGLLAFVGGRKLRPQTA